MILKSLGIVEYWVQRLGFFGPEISLLWYSQSSGHKGPVTLMYRTLVEHAHALLVVRSSHVVVRHEETCSASGVGCACVRWVHV